MGNKPFNNCCGQESENKFASYCRKLRSHASENIMEIQTHQICIFFMTSFLSYLYYKVRCVFVCHYCNIQTLTSPPVLKLWDTQGYLWLPYDLTEVIKLIGETFGPKNIFFSQKILHVIPSALLSFLPDDCHSFQIFVIPSGFLSFLPN